MKIAEFRGVFYIRSSFQEILETYGIYIAIRSKRSVPSPHPEFNNRNRKSETDRLYGSMTVNMGQPHDPHLAATPYKRSQSSCRTTHTWPHLAATPLLPPPPSSHKTSSQPQPHQRPWRLGLNTTTSSAAFGTNTYILIQLHIHIYVYFDTPPHRQSSTATTA